MNYFKQHMNYFKPHIVQLNTGKFAIRKLTLLGFRLYDADNYSKFGTWPISMPPCYYSFSTLEEAKTYLAKLTPHITKVYEN
jgi:hypothetical protein